MQIVIEGNHLSVTEALRDHIMKQIKRIKKRCGDATDVIARIAGKTKNGWAQSIQVEVHVKGAVLTTKQYLCRSVKDLYTTIKHAFRSIEKRVEHHTAMRMDKLHRKSAVFVRNAKVSAAR